MLHENFTVCAIATFSLLLQLIILAPWCMHVCVGGITVHSNDCVFVKFFVKKWHISFSIAMKPQSIIMSVASLTACNCANHVTIILCCISTRLICCLISTECWSSGTTQWDRWAENHAETLQGKLLSFLPHYHSLIYEFCLPYHENRYSAVTPWWHAQLAADIKHCHVPHVEAQKNLFIAITSPPTSSPSNAWTAMKSA